MILLYVCGLCCARVYRLYRHPDYGVPMCLPCSRIRIFTVGNVFRAPNSAQYRTDFRRHAAGYEAVHAERL